MKIYTKEELLKKSLVFLSSLESDFEEDVQEAENLKIVRFLINNLRKSQKVVCEANEIDEELKKLYGPNITLKIFYDCFIDTLKEENNGLPSSVCILTGKDAEMYQEWLEQ